MNSAPSRKRRRKIVFQHAYDWVNNCELSQLDAVLAAVFVFSVGCLILISLFVIGKVQAILSYRSGQWTQQRAMPQSPMLAPGSYRAPEPPMFASVNYRAPAQSFAYAGYPLVPQRTLAASENSGAHASCVPTCADAGFGRLEACAPGFRDAGVATTLHAPLVAAGEPPMVAAGQSPLEATMFSPIGQPAYFNHVSSTWRPVAVPAYQMAPLVTASVYSLPTADAIFQSRFGRPRQQRDSWHPFAHQQYGQAEASTSSTY